MNIVTSTKCNSGRDTEARFGRILLKYIDRLSDPTPEDSLEDITREMLHMVDLVMYDPDERTNFHRNIKLEMEISKYIKEGKPEII